MGVASVHTRITSKHGSVDIPVGATGTIVIDLAQASANWCALARHVAPAACAAVVKADAYGMGAARIIPALVAAGCRHFFVATPQEASAAPGHRPDKPNYALDGLIPGTALDLMRIRAMQQW